ncbi:hypothetical protein FH972_023284 [Carpinus fangiana]|uniref:Bms1-type G domain-containing protein n=1 Tax=Carpinus fangiana TaxID=176857 RepID=A0A5N6KUS1_9ROSI|nr:hypothetical protein FH972_023284 [Carpinus fangiana]
MPALVDHHHRNTTKVSNKSFKPRFTSKSALKDRSKGKLSTEKGPRKTRYQEVMSKFDRRNQAKQRKLNKAKEHAQTTQIFQGRDGAPRNVAVVPLCEPATAAGAVRSLNKSLDIEDDVPEEGRARIHIDRFKQKLSYTTVKRELLSALDACRAADYVLLILSAEEEVDAVGDLILRSIESQGISNVYTAVQGLDKVEPSKRRTQVLASLKSYITHFFPDQERVFSLESVQEGQNLIRSLCTTTPKGIRWREERSWMQVDEVEWPSDIPNTDPNAIGDVVITGVVRGKNLKADRLIQVGDWGDFRISAITAAPVEQARKGKDHVMAVDNNQAENALDLPTGDQDTLEDLAPEEAVMEDIEATTMAASTMASDRKGVLLDDQHYYSDDAAEEVEAIPKRVPHGTSKYQSAWYLGDASDSGSDMEDMDDDNAMDDDVPMLSEAGPVPADGMEGFVAPSLHGTEAAPSEYPQSEMFDDVAPDDADLTAYRERRNAEDAEDDLKFPDEVELQPNVNARERLARYRGLKSLRTSPWDTEEDRPYMPLDWARLLDISDYKGARSRVIREAFIGGVKPGLRVAVHLKSVPLSFQQSYSSSQPLAAFSLLRHEHKRTAVNVSLSLSSEYPAPLKSKDELILQVGPRRMIINPLFSQLGNTPNDVHKFDRYLHPGRTVVASFTAPLTWGSVPALFFKKTSTIPKRADDDDEESVVNANEMDTDAAPPSLTPALSLIGHGTTLAPSTSRIIAKRIVLTGEPFKINRRLVTIRYMFFTAEDVAWFKALPLWTNRGRQGTIKESLGTHGYFKAMFDSKVGLQDAVGVSLYKRVWPRSARLIKAGELF